MSKARGTKQEVWDGVALKTAGGLTRADLMLNRRGKVISIKQNASGQARYPVLAAALRALREAGAQPADIMQGEQAPPLAEEAEGKPAEAVEASGSGLSRLLRGRRAPKPPLVRPREFELPPLPPLEPAPEDRPPQLAIGGALGDQEPEMPPPPALAAENPVGSVQLGSLTAREAMARVFDEYSRLREHDRVERGDAPGALTPDVLDVEDERHTAELARFFGHPVTRLNRAKTLAHVGDRIGELLNLADLAADRDVGAWNPSSVEEWLSQLILDYGADAVQGALTRVADWMAEAEANGSMYSNESRLIAASDWFGRRPSPQLHPSKDEDEQVEGALFERAYNMALERSTEDQSLHVPYSIDELDEFLAILESGKTSQPVTDLEELIHSSLIEAIRQLRDEELA
jgi:hypothetical protein